MNVRAKPDTTAEAVGRYSTLDVAETYWGYAAEEKDADAASLSFLRIAALFVGIVLVLSGALQWLLPSSEGAAPMVFKAVLSFFFATAGILLCRYASGTGTPVVEVDTEKREVRFQLRPRSGTSRTVRRVKMAEIEGVFTIQKSEPGSQSEMYLRLRSGGAPIVVLKGDEADLRRLRIRMTEDLQPPEMRLMTRLSNPNPVRKGVAAG
ncbi:MAG: hypothetical protein AAFR35_06090 [Pseudomonadota bacterium]